MPLLAPPLPVTLTALATAVPEHVIPQSVAAERARAFFGHRMRDYERLAGVFDSTGIEQRYSVCPVEWFEQPHAWAERNTAYLAGACELYERVVVKALAQAHLAPHEIDAVVTVSSTGIATPSLEARVLPGLGFRSDITRVPVFGLGCAGGVSGLALARRLALAEPGARVLLVAVELCTLSFRLDRATKADIIATSLFGDGAAAAVLTTQADGPSLGTLRDAYEHQWPKTLDIMGWSADDIALGVILSRSLPAFIAKNYRAVFERVAERFDTAAHPLGRVIAHPGGTRVLDALESMLALPAGGLDHERSVMRDFGNMSSPTVLFVLERAIAAGLPTHAMLAALGPGFTASFVALDGPNAG